MPSLPPSIPFYLVNNRTSGGFVPVSINYPLICFLPFFFWSGGGLALSCHPVAMRLCGWIVCSPLKQGSPANSWCLVTCSSSSTWFIVVSFGSLLCRAGFSHRCVQLFATPWTAAGQAPLSLGILQARMLDWVAMPCSRGSSQPRDPAQVSRIAGGFSTA